jgi:glutamate 5-kinase
MFDLKSKKKIVIKIGSALLIEDGEIRNKWLDSLAKDIRDLKKYGMDIVIVSSGAIALGKKYLKNKSQKLKLPEKQAAAALGQIELMSVYKNHFAKYKINVAQILLTNDESETRSKYLNSRNTFNTLLANDTVPIVNENDSVATEEIKIGDNDRLAARVAQMIDADLLILFSDIDGLYDKNPKIHHDAKFIPLVEKITKEIEEMASGAISSVGTGGMAVKIKAAKMAFNLGCDTIITEGIPESPIKKLMTDGRYTIFKASKNKISSRKIWIADSLNPKGEIIINECAVEALMKGSSLLPIGVVKITGNFSKGDQVLVKDEKKNHIATGLSSYSSIDAKLIIGKKTFDAKKIIEKNFKKELIHRDNMVVNKF